MTEQPRVTIDAPSEFVILAARHLDATEGPVQVGSVVDTSTRSAIDRVVAYVTKAHNSIAAPGTPPSGPAGASSANTGHVERLEIANRELKTASIEAIERAEQAEAERDRYARLADDRAEHITRLTADRDGLRTRLAEQEAETMRQHEQAEEFTRRALGQRQEMAEERHIWQERGDRAEAAIARVHDALASFDGRGVVAPGRNNFDIPTTGEVLDKVRAALDDPQPTTPADEQYKFATTWAEYNAGRKAAADRKAATPAAAEVRDCLFGRSGGRPCTPSESCATCTTPAAVEHPDAQAAGEPGRRRDDDLRALHAAVSRIRNIDRVPPHVDPDSTPGRFYINGWEAALDRVRTELVDLPGGAGCSPGVPETEPDNPAVAELAQAIRLTREYVGADLLPAVEGWAWYDALRKWAPHELPTAVAATAGTPNETTGAVDGPAESEGAPEPRVVRIDRAALGLPPRSEDATPFVPAPPAPVEEPGTVTDPAWLSTQYAKALDEAFSTFNPDETEDAYLTTHIVNTVMRVRDRHVAQLRQRLTLAEHFHQDIATVRERADRYAATLREVLDALDRNGGVPPTEADVDRWRATLGEQPDDHIYLSTGCRHGDHAYCKNMTGLNGSKRPGECKHCGAHCICPCHTATKEQP